MKQLLLFVFALLLFACKKDKVDEECGVLFDLSPRSDGGVEEVLSWQGCGGSLATYAQAAKENPDYALVIYKGGTRPKATYLLVHYRTGGGAVTRYIRYESGQVPDSTIDAYKWDAMVDGTDIKQMTGLERVKW